MGADSFHFPAAVLADSFTSSLRTSSASWSLMSLFLTSKSSSAPASCARATVPPSATQRAAAASVHFFIKGCFSLVVAQRLSGRGVGCFALKDELRLLQPYGDEVTIAWARN